MVTPTKSEIIDKAFSIHAKRNHNITAITPTEQELKETGEFEEARAELMRTDHRYRTYIEQEARSLGMLDDKIEKKERAAFTVDLEEAMKTGIFISGTSQSGKSNLAFVVADMLMSKYVIVFVIDPSQVWKKSSVPNMVEVSYGKDVNFKDGNALNGKPFRNGTVFDTSRLTVLQQKEFVEALCKNIFERRVNSKIRPQTFLFFEEAHLFFPEGSMRSKRYQEALRIITVGANFNIRFGLITQWCALIDKTVIKFPRQRFFGYSDEKNDKEYLRNFIGDTVDELETLEVGEFIYDYGKITKRVQTPLFRLEH